MDYKPYDYENDMPTEYLYNAACSVNLNALRHFNPNDVAIIEDFEMTSRVSGDVERFIVLRDCEDYGSFLTINTYDQSIIWEDDGNGFAHSYVGIEQILALTSLVDRQERGE